ncbi:MAG: hypothetical protein A2005_06085 [Desulfuromonadales bacterium GWC2_61_20]|nr:MAG: hypothetical protein A2005_06085 [Desulfuromonadales bacterium GWC2_61_20]HAD04401.1 hypothetical protein [Desulfuromonas sp.]
MTLSLGLRQKILLTLGGLILFIGLASAIVVKYNFSRQLRQELEKRGVSIACNLARQAADPVLARDRLGLKLLAIEQAQTEEDIVYIFFVRPRGNEVLAHTFGRTFPGELLTANTLAAGERFHLRYLSTEQGPIYDIAAPIGAGGGLGQVRVGISTEPISRAVNALSGEILIITLTFGAIAFLLSIPLSTAIVLSLQQLTTATAAVAEGDYTTPIAIGGSDEIGRLAASFNRMITRLEAARLDLQTRNSELAGEVERRRTAEDELAAQLTLISTLVDEIPTPVFFKDIQGRYRGCNRAFEELIGIHRAELLGHTVSDVLTAEEAAVHLASDRDLLAHPGSCYYELPFTGRDQKKREVACRKATYNDHSGRVAGIVGILVDVTRERETDRLRTDFVSTAAHEFQTPLTAIIGFSEVLQLEKDLDPVTRDEYLAIIHERGVFLSRLVDRFLDVSRIEAGRAVPLDPSPCRPKPVLDALLASYRARNSGHRFEVRLPGRCPLLLVDKDRFTQILENLLSNAVKYAPSGSRIQISGETVPAGFRLRLHNEGPGLSPETLARIFEKFYRADASDHAPSGTGLGLYITRAIVEAHGGQIDATSSPGAGVTFTVILPLAPDTSSPAQPPS